MEPLLIICEPKLDMRPFLSPLPAPSSTTSMKIPHATEKPVREVRSLFCLRDSNISLRSSLISESLSICKFFYVSFL